MRVHAIECDLPPDCSCVGVMTSSNVSVMTPPEDYREQWKQAEARRRAATNAVERRAATDETVRIYHRANWTAAEFLRISQEVTNELRGPSLTRDQEPRKRGSWVVDRDGRRWVRGTRLWAHEPRRDPRQSNKQVEDFEGRYVWADLVSRYGPLWEIR